uniref:Uncharacterized protein n=1 Tax=Candidatus Kentrum sp. DK TaxID=2126562 RepID=A0A450SL31_9GAMM|nr:MAG: hypothetical protein BECKDK2373B_GA0170837_104617 [Candidatus Kentron sp. DK]
MNFLKQEIEEAGSQATPGRHHFPSILSADSSNPIRSHTKSRLSTNSVDNSVEYLGESEKKSTKFRALRYIGYIMTNKIKGLLFKRLIIRLSSTHRAGGR